MTKSATLYTRTGDDGYTGVLGRERIAKYDLQPVACGAVDELSATLGLARTAVEHPCSSDIIIEIQRDLYAAMADLATTPEAAGKSGCRLGATRIDWLESIIDEVGSQVEIPPAFIISGDSYAGALLDLARTVARRAERHTAKLHHQAMLCNPNVLHYLNRLSSLFFVLSRLEDKAAGVEKFTLASFGARP